MSLSSRPASGPASIGSAKLPPPRASGVMIWRARPRTCWATSSETATCCPGGLGEVPGVDQELDGQDAQGGVGGHLVRADLDRAVEPADVPGLERGLGRRGDPRLQRTGNGTGTGLAARRGIGQSTEVRDRSDQVIGQLRHVELGAHRGLMVIVLGDAPQDPLADGQRGLGGAQRIQVGLGRPFVRARVPGGGRGGQPAEVVRPARGVAGFLLAGQPFVRQVDHGPARGGLQRDDHGRPARRQLCRPLPAPGEHDAAARLHLVEGAGGRVPGNDGPPVLPAGPQVDARGDHLPAAQPVRLGDQGEGLVGVQRDEDRLLERHRCLLQGTARASRTS